MFATTGRPVCVGNVIVKSMTARLLSSERAKSEPGKQYSIMDCRPLAERHARKI
jgi:hypothetical protein